MLLRDRRLTSRRQMDRIIRDRAEERTNGNETAEGTTYFPALSRWLSGDAVAEIRAVLLVMVLVAAAFVFGRWVGQQGTDDVQPQSVGIVSLV